MDVSDEVVDKFVAALMETLSDQLAITGQSVAEPVMKGLQEVQFPAVVRAAVRELL